MIRSSKRKTRIKRGEENVHVEVLGRLANATCRIWFGFKEETSLYKTRRLGVGEDEGPCLKM